MYRLYPLRFTRSYWQIPLYSQHQCSLQCCFDIEYDTVEETFRAQANRSYNPVTRTCDMHSRIFATGIHLSSFDVTKPSGTTGTLYNPDLEVIQDSCFTILIDFPLTHPVQVNVTMNGKVTLRNLLYMIQQIYLDIYEMEASTATIQEFNIDTVCSCRTRDLQETVRSLPTIASTNECSICYNELDVACTLSCMHQFHPTCLQQWIHTGHGRNCPLCRNYILTCTNCNNTGIVSTTESYTVLPIELRDDPTIRNATDGTYGIFGFDFEQLTLHNLIYNKQNKFLQLVVYHV